MTRIELPWPPQQLSPNARVHWSEAARKKARCRKDAFYLARANGAPSFDGRVSVSITFRPPDNRKRDLDNMLAANKAHLDGIADFIGVDDSNWSISIKRGEPVKYGAVIVELEAA